MNTAETALIRNGSARGLAEVPEGGEFLEMAGAEATGLPANRRPSHNISCALKQGH